MHNTAKVIEHVVGNNRRVGYVGVIDFKPRHDVHDDAEAGRLVGRERLAQRARHHCLFAADHHRQEVGGAADGRRSVLGSGLAEVGQVLGDGEITGHADFLAAADAHAVDPADDRLVAAQNGRHHVVEQPHVLAVFLRVAGIVFGIFLGVAAGAEGLVADRREDHGVNFPVDGSAAESEDRRLHHFRRVGIVLGRIVEDDPGVVQAFGRAAVEPCGRAFLVDQPVAFHILDLDQVVVDEGFGFGLVDDVGCFIGHRIGCSISLLVLNYRGPGWRAASACGRAPLRKWH